MSEDKRQPEENSLEESYDRGFLVPSTLHFEIAEGFELQTEFETCEWRDGDSTQSDIFDSSRGVLIPKYGVKVIFRYVITGGVASSGEIIMVPKGLMHVSSSCESASSQPILEEVFVVTSDNAENEEACINAANEWIRAKHLEVYNRFIGKIPVGCFVGKKRLYNKA